MWLWYKIAGQLNELRGFIGGNKPLSAIVDMGPSVT